MKKRILSLLLACCMLLSILPASALAAPPQEAEALYLQMLELGLVDSDGALIEDNRFTVEDGTRLASLSELLDWLAQCDESDLNTLITVDATGRSATVEQLAQAIALEYDMAEIAAQLNALAAGSGVSVQNAGDAAPSAGQDLRLKIFSSWSSDEVSTDTMTIIVGVADSSNQFCPAPHDIVIEAGLFCDFLSSGRLPVTVDGSQAPGIKSYKTFTIPQGEKFVEFKLDLVKIRSLLVAQRKDLWDGYATMLFQSRVVSGMAAGSARYVIGLAPESAPSEIMGLLQQADTVCQWTGVSSGFVPYAVDLSGAAAETVNGTSVYRATVPEIQGKESAESDTRSWSSAYRTAVDSGVGDAVLRLQLSEVTLLAPRGTEFASAPTLYAVDDGTLIKMSQGYAQYNSFVTADAVAYAKSVAAAYTGNWSYSDSGDMKSFYNQLKNGDYKLTRFRRVWVPINDNLLIYDWAVNADWTAGGVKPTNLLCTGNISMVDQTAPTVTSVEMEAYSINFSQSQAKIYEDFYPGEMVPITVTFSEPVYGTYQLAIQSGAETTYLSSADYDYTGLLVNRDDNPLSKTRTFYYPVQDADSTCIEVLGVRAVGSDCADVLGNRFENAAGGYQEYAVTLAEGHIHSTRPQDSVVSMQASADPADPRNATVTVQLKTGEAFAQLWSNWYNTAEADRPFTAHIVLNQDTGTAYPLTVAENGDGTLSLVCALTLDAVDADTDYLAELYLDNELYYGAYATFTQKAVVKADETAYTIAADRWPSGLEQIVYLQDEDAPTFHASSNGTDFTYHTADQLYWASSDENVIQLFTAGDSLSLADSPTVGIVAAGAGTASLCLMAKNGGIEETVASNTVTITVNDGGSPSLLFPKNANTVYARKDTDQLVRFASNLANHAPAGGSISVSLKDAAGAEVWTAALDRAATSLTIPGEYLSDISRNDVPAYTLTLSAAAEVDGQTSALSTTASIIVRAQPVAVTLTGLDSPQFLSGESISFGWTLEHFDLEANPDDCAFQLLIEKDGRAVESTADPGEKTADQAYAGTLRFTPDSPSGLKDYYVITVKAKNGADPTWSVASSTVTVYRRGAMQILVGGSAADSVTLENEVSGSATSTDPTITSYGGETYAGLTNAQAIARLRSQLALTDTISINYDAYDWSMLRDTVVWSTSTGRGGEITDELDRAVTINYRRGSLYEPLEKFSYTSYLPQVVMLLCGLRDGTNVVTAAHNSVSGLSDSVTVNVNRLKDQLYLFQFTPAVKTELSYEDGLGRTHTVYSNSDGSLALFEPNGIASELRTASVDSGTSYRGTFSPLGLKSGEGNGSRGELYPLNALSLRLAAVAQVTLLRPDGTALANADVTLRGGVYRNRVLAERRDDAYCSGAMFAKAAGQAANLDGKAGQTFTTDENGVLTVHMDLEQFTSANDPGRVGVGDSLQFIFELQFENDAYYPELVTVNGSLTARDAMRSGENIVRLTATEGRKPVVAEQTVDYYTGRQISVRNHTGVVGPSSNYPQAVLESTVMLWGVDGVSLDDTSCRTDLRAQQNAVSLPEQASRTVKESSFPFSSIPLVINTAQLNSDSFVHYTASRKTPMEVAVYSAGGRLACTLCLPFGLADLTAIEKVEDSPSLTSLMANLAIYGSVGGANTDYDLVNTVSDGVMNTALTFVTEMGAEAGLVKAILMPTEDPTRYTGYFWTGMNTTKLEDLNYDAHGISIEPSYIGQDYDSFLGQVNDTFTLSDFQAMADGSYFDDRSSLYGAVSSAIGMPVMLVLEGWMSTEIRYNFDKGRWEVLTTGGGFTAGGQLEFEKAINLKPFPVTFSFKVRGGVTVDFQAAVRYAEQLGLEWNDETARAVNDYLTALRINAYFEVFGGIGYDKGFTAKVGDFGSIEINNENRFLTRSYLKNADARGLKGQFLQLDGEVGIRAALGVGPVVTEITLFSVSFSNQWRFNDWNAIVDYWEAASSGLGSTGWTEGQPGGQSLVRYSANGLSVTAGASVALQSRDYLTQADRTWNSGGGISMLSLDEPGALSALQTNAYPYSYPQISDDGGLLVYLSDADSSDVTDVEVRYTQMDGGSFPDGAAIPDGEDGFAGYGDSSLDFDGTAGFAGAVWLREAATVGLKAGSELNDSQRLALLGGLEVVASIWNGSQWTTTRLTSNSTQELSPVIAVNESGRAIAAWRSVQSGETIYNLDQDRILFKLYDGRSWSDETYTLYNGSAGSVSGLTAEMLPDGTAAIAYALNDEIYYAVIDTASSAPEDNAKTIRATTNEYTDEAPQLTTAGDAFVLGWHSVQNLTGAEQHDVELCVFDTAGAPRTDFPASLSDLVSTASFDGRFAFVKGAESLDALSILWNDAGAGEQDNDVLRAVKFGQYGGSYGSSAAIQVAALPGRTASDHFEAYALTPDGTTIQAVMQGTTHSDTEFDEVQYSYELDGTSYTRTVLFPRETVNLYTATETYQDAVEVSGTYVDFSTLRCNAWTPVSLTVTNQGLHVIRSLTVAIDGAASQTFPGLNLLPGQSETICAVAKTGNPICDLSYTVTAAFTGSDSQTAEGIIHLDYPDVGLSPLYVAKEEDGERTILASLYNQSAASLSSGSRRVVLGVYSDPECETPMNGKYFADGTDGAAYELVLSDSELAAIDAAGFSHEIPFLIGRYVADAGLHEIPDAGVTLFVKARIEQPTADGWIILPEADSQNNQRSLTFDSLLVRSEGAPATISVELRNGATTTAAVRVRNNSLQPRSSGNLIAALLDENGRLLETRNIGGLSFQSEEVKLLSVAFTQSGARVVLRYGEPVSSSPLNANAASITLDGLPLTLSDFDAADNAVIENVSTGSYLLTVIPEQPDATITIDGRPAADGTAEIEMFPYNRTIVITITAPDGATTRTYTITLVAASGRDEGINRYTLRFATNGGSAIDPIQKAAGTTVDLTAYTPTRDGYRFTGWFRDKGLTEPVTSLKLTGDTTVYAGWIASAGTSPFADVPGGAYYEDAVIWAVEQGITTGASDTLFRPDMACTRAQAVTFLWRAAGSPAPQSDTMPFADVSSDSYYYSAVLWAVENGITAGTSSNTFSPDAACTRAQIVTFLWRAQELPAADAVNPFTDVAGSDYFFQAVLWTVERGITTGTGNTTFSPDMACTRAQIVTFLYRCLN